MEISFFKTKKKWDRYTSISREKTGIGVFPRILVLGKFFTKKVEGVVYGADNQNPHNHESSVPNGEKFGIPVKFGIKFRNIAVNPHNERKPSEKRFGLIFPARILTLR